MNETRQPTPGGLPVKDDDGTPFYLEFTPIQLLELAVWMERTGAEFYRFLSERSDDPEVKEFFLGLMNAELAHEKNLRRIYREVANEELEYLGIEEGKITGAEYLKRLKQAAKKKIFLNQIQVPDTEGLFSVERGLEMALTIEEKSVKLYTYLGKFRVYGGAQEIIDKLRKDEIGHIEHISQLARKRGRENPDA